MLALRSSGFASTHAAPSSNDALVMSGRSRSSSSCQPRPAFEDFAGKEMIDAFVGPSGRRSTAEEQAWPLLFLNSPRSSYVTGEAFHTDAGFLAAQTTGQL